ncbi:MAG: phosphoenolpyruvate--protein phosphotransferase [Firmicutes bacterium]|nr:phosphoenolpyruvate--protein phosphotransferase [Bacillota bacterium]
MNVLKGVGIAEGIAFGRLKAYKKDCFSIYSIKIYTLDHTTEILRYKRAKEVAISQLDDLYRNAVNEIGEEHAMVFKVHRMMIEDIDYANSVVNIIEDENANAEYAVWLTSRNFERTFENMDGEYMQQRAGDIRDISRRIVNCMVNPSLDKVLEKRTVIIGCDDLAPSEILELNKKYVKGFITILGSKNSHTSIIAKAVNLPAVISLGDQLKPEFEGCDVIVDSFAGAVYISPDRTTVRRLKRKKELCNRQQELLFGFKGKEDITLDGQKIELCANIGHIADIEAVKESDASGVGLFRSEFIFMGRHDYPTEDEQFKIYKTVAQKMGNKHVVVRTLDVGADKHIQYFDLPKEVNPAMGYRGIRICLDRTNIFKTQLKAILRASAFGNIEILFPMISSLEEILQTKIILQESKEELCEKGIPYNENIKIGIMIETPAAVFISDILAKEVDFFSIGTNDLIQYALAVDRQNDKVNFMFNPQHRAILRMIKLVCENSKKAGIRVGICGEIAADEHMTEIFLSLGIDELSMSAPFVLGIRKKVRETNVTLIRDKIISKL